ncbi:unnamed protein product [Amoebophrya sp. A120]|nr:unnamed protein product [Amoebophrya sp. A120]|eukprot:GSA120T00016450001.1
MTNNSSPSVTARLITQVFATQEQDAPISAPLTKKRRISAAPVADVHEGTSDVVPVRKSSPNIKPSQEVKEPAAETRKQDAFVFLTEEEVRELEQDIHYQSYDISCAGHALSSFHTEAQRARLLQALLEEGHQKAGSSHAVAPSSSSTAPTPHQPAGAKKLADIKGLLNKEKTKINRYQLNMTKDERLATFLLHSDSTGKTSNEDRNRELVLNPKTKEIDFLLVLKNWDKIFFAKRTTEDLSQLKERVTMDVFYAKLTDAVYLMHFKKQLVNELNLKRFSNAALKLTEVLVKEDLIVASSGRAAAAATSLQADVDHAEPPCKSTSSSFRHFANAELPGSFLCAVNCRLRLLNSFCANQNDVGKKDGQVTHHYDHYSWVGNSLLPGDMGPNSPGLPDYWGYYERFPDKWLMRESFFKQCERLLQQTRLVVEVNLINATSTTTSTGKEGRSAADSPPAPGVVPVVPPAAKTKEQDYTRKVFRLRDEKGLRQVIEQQKSLVNTVNEKELYPEFATHVETVTLAAAGSRGPTYNTTEDASSTTHSTAVQLRLVVRKTAAHQRFVFLHAEIKDMFANVGVVAGFEEQEGDSVNQLEEQDPVSEPQAAEDKTTRRTELVVTLVPLLQEPTSQNQKAESGTTSTGATRRTEKHGDVGFDIVVPQEHQQDMNGDICDRQNLRFIEDFFRSNKQHLYTSDAGIGLDVDEYAEQECVEMKLKLAEVVCGLLSLAPGGHFCIKMYTFFEPFTLQVLLLLGLFFEELKITKPMASKPTNSEVYLVGRGFKGEREVDAKNGIITTDSKLRQKVLELFLARMDEVASDGTPSHGKKDVFDDSDFFPHDLIEEKDLDFVAGIADKIYLRQALWINRNLFYMQKHYKMNPAGSNMNKKPMTLQDIHKTTRRVQERLKPTVSGYFKRFVAEYEFHRKLTDEENEVVF